MQRPGEKPRRQRGRVDPRDLRDSAEIEQAVIGTSARGDDGIVAVLIAVRHRQGEGSNHIPAAGMCDGIG